MKLNKNIYLSIGVSIFLCSSLQAGFPLFKACPDLDKVAQSVINVKEPAKKALAHATRIASSVVSIQTDRNGNSTQTSGFLITEDGYIATSYLHVKNADSLTVTLLNGTKLPATLVQKGNSDLDAAIIKIDANELPYIPLNNPNEPMLSWIFSIGCPISGNQLTTISLLKEKTHSKNITIEHIQADSLHSGSPLFDLDGSLIGMHLGCYPLGKERLCGEPLDKGFAIPLSVLQEKKKQIENPHHLSESEKPGFLIYSRHYKCLWK